MPLQLPHESRQLRESVQHLTRITRSVPRIERIPMPPVRASPALLTDRLNDCLVDRATQQWITVAARFISPLIANRERAGCRLDDSEGSNDRPVGQPDDAVHLGSDLRTVHAAPPANKGAYWSIRRRAIAMYSGLSSHRTALRPSFRATSPVVPEPPNGSRTMQGTHSALHLQVGCQP